jgi:ATP-dependent helicase/nuclease subunit A
VTEEVVAPDAAPRARIAGDLDRTLFVEAGAGSGKTTELVRRVLALVETGSAELAAIAAITFSEKAAAELRDRVRAGLERALTTDHDPAAADRHRLALAQLDGAAIGTLHSFAQRILSEHPIEAGLPPRVEVVDEVNSEVEFERRWRTFRDELLAAPTLERTIGLMTAAGVRFSALRAVAVAFNENWDLVEERVPDDVPDPPDVMALVAPVRAAIDRICIEPCGDPHDAMCQFVDDVRRYAATLATITDEVDLLEALDPDGPTKPPSFRAGGKGRQQNWSTDLATLRTNLKDVGERLNGLRTDVANACVERLGCELRRFTLRAAEERRLAGRLEFHDLLVRARALLRHPVDGVTVRAGLHQRYRRLLLDEFQDTDPIQVELAALIAAAPGQPVDGVDWASLDVVPGHLFFVGDPKQSIYRFRRADIATFLSAQAHFGGGQGGGDGDRGENGASNVVRLSANFRATVPVIQWVNTTFGALITEVSGSQPAYGALEAVRPPGPVGPAVGIVGRQPHPKEFRADQLREAEAADVATTVVRIVDEGWSVGDGDGGWRPAQLGDITVLVPARTSLPFLEDALDARRIAYRAESSSLVYSTRAVRDLLMVLRAVADPTNHLHVVAALRTPLFACGDDDLFRFHSRNRSWSYLSPRLGEPDEGDRVHAALTYLRGLYEQRHWLAPSELLDRIAQDRRAMDLGFAEGRPRDVWRRIRFVIDQARAWSEATGGNLRQYLAWVELQLSDGARVAEAILPETDDDAVRIMTIHGAKGLEFPVTIVSGMSTKPQGRPAQAEVVFPPTGRVGYKVGRAAKTDEYMAWAPIDEQMSYHERIRLLYVACTRARDHLVVSLHRASRANAPEAEKRTNAELLLDGMGEAAVGALPDVGDSDGAAPGSRTAPPPPPPPRQVWERELAAALARAATPTTVSATSLTEEGEPDVEQEPVDPGFQKRPRDLDLPPWLKGRYGTAVGRAVHGVLQTIDLATGDGLDDAVAAQCEAEAVTARASEVRRLVNDALGSRSVREAAASPHWREVYVCVPVQDRQLEGYIDLLYRGPEGLVVVDYKTSSTSDPEDLARRVEGYRVQGCSYALAVRDATGEPVTRVTFAFLTPDGPVELDLGELGQGMAEVEELVGRSPDPRRGR